MRFKYEIPRLALIEASRLQSGLRPAIMGGSILFVALAAMIVWNIRAQGTTFQYAYALLFPAFAGFVFFVGFALVNRFLFIPIRMAAFHRQNPAWFGEMEVAQDQEGIEFNSTRSTARYRWSDFRGFKENDKIFLLCLSKSVSFPIPKQGLSPETIEDIRRRWGQRLKRLR